jgi:hypothetical protein
MFLRVFCQCAAALQEQPEDVTRAPGGVWAQATASFNGEQLAYIAALACGSQLLFGDRPKHITYRWRACVHVCVLGGQGWSAASTNATRQLSAAPAAL